MSGKENLLFKLSGLVGDHACWKANLNEAIVHKYPLNATKLARADCCEFGLFVHNKDTARQLGSVSALSRCSEFA